MAGFFGLFGGNKPKNEGALTQEEFDAYQSQNTGTQAPVGWTLKDPSMSNDIQAFKAGLEAQRIERTLADDVYDKEQRLGKSMIGGGDRAIDDRNWFQKLTNLNANASVLSQGLDLFSRPANMLVGAVEGLTRKADAGLSEHMLNSMSDEEVLAYAKSNEALKSGNVLDRIGARAKLGVQTAVEDLAGQRNSSGGQIVRNLTEGGRTEDGKFDTSDIVGFGVDIAMPNPLVSTKLFKSGKITKGIDQAVEEAEILSRAGDNLTSTMETISKASQRKEIMAETYESLRNVAGKAGEFDANLDSLYKLTKGRGSKKALAEFSSGTSEIVNAYASKADDMSKIFEGTNLRGSQNILETLAKRKQTHISPLAKGFEMAGDTVSKVMSPVSELFKNKVDARAITAIEELADARGLEGLARTDFIAKKLSVEEASSFQRFKGLFDKSLKDPLRAIDANKKLTADMTNAMKKRSGDFLDTLEQGFESGMYSEFANKEELGEAVLSLFEHKNMAPEIMDFESLFKTLEKPTRSTLNATDEAVSGLNSLEQFIKASGAKQILGSDELYNVYSDAGEEFIKINKEIFNPSNREAFADVVNSFVENGGENAFNFGKTKSEFIKGLESIAEVNPNFAKASDEYGNLLSTIRETAGSYITDNPNTYEAITQAGYTPHVRTQEVQDFVNHVDKSGTVFGDDILNNKAHLDDVEATFQRNIGRTHGRALQGTTEDVNKLMKQDMKSIIGSPESVALFGGKNELYEEAKKVFVDGDYFSKELGRSLDNIIDGTYKGYEAKVKETSDVLIASIFGNQKANVEVGDASLIKVISKDAKLPASDKIEMTKQNIEAMVDILDKRGLQIGATEQLDLLRSKFRKALENGDRVIVEKSLAPRLDGFLKVDQPDTALLLKQYKEVNNLFKKLKTSSIGFNERNAKGNFHNSVLAGMSAEEAMVSPFKGRNFLQSLNDVAEQVIADGFGGLTPEQIELFGEYKSLVNTGLIDDNYTKQLVGMIDEAGNAVSRFGGKAGEVIEAPTSVLGKVKSAHDKWIDLNMKGNQIVDDSFRLGTYLHAKENPAFMLRMGVDNPVDMARLVNFDPRGLSLMESEYVRQVVPFYTFTRQNMMFQLKNIQVNPERYVQTARVTDKAWQAVTGRDSSNLRGYEKDEQYLPSLRNLFLTDEEKANGTYYTHKTGLPFTDLGDAMSNPLDFIVGASAPQVKGLYEFMNNKNFFTGQDIEKYSGEMDPRYPWSKKTGHLMGVTGLDVPAKQVVDIGKLGIEVAQGNLDEAISSFNNLLGSTGKGSFTKNEDSLKYDQIRRLDELIAEAKRNGLAVPTKTELKQMGLWTDSEYDIAMKQSKKRRR